MEKLMGLISSTDSIAGQMAALKGQPTAADSSQPKRRATSKKAADEESDYESDTDDDEEDDASETDTDTDSEAEEEKAKKKKGWW